VKSLSKHGSNIHSVELQADGQVKIIGAFTNVTDCAVTLLHIWLAQPEADGMDGVGLACDALYSVDTNRPDCRFELPPQFGANNAKFRNGPAIVSAIAVISPKTTAKERVTDVIQWDRSLTLSQGEER
jgi:hypothetical protein